MKRCLVVVSSISLLLLGFACSASVGTKPTAVSGARLEKRVSDALSEKVGQTPDAVSCPHELRAEKGATTRCVLTAGQDELGVTVTTKSVSDEGRVAFSIEVDQTAQN